MTSALRDDQESAFARWLSLGWRQRVYLLGMLRESKERQFTAGPESWEAHDAAADLLRAFSTPATAELVEGDGG